MPLLLTLLLLVLFLHGPTSQAAVVCDGVDDALQTAVVVNQLLSVSTGTIIAVVNPTGTVSPSPGSKCWAAELYVSDSNLYATLGRSSNFAGSGDQLCAGNASTSGDEGVGASYTANVYTHLAWRHSGGTLSFWKDGIAVGSTPSADTSDALATPLLVCRGAPGGGSDGLPAQGAVALVTTHATALTDGELRAVGPSRLHWLTWSPPSTHWDFADCADGASGDGVGFRDTSGNLRTITAAGTTCAGSSHLSYPWGVE